MRAPAGELTCTTPPPAPRVIAACPTLPPASLVSASVLTSVLASPAPARGSQARPSRAPRPLPGSTLSDSPTTPPLPDRNATCTVLAPFTVPPMFACELLKLVKMPMFMSASQPAESGSSASGRNSSSKDAAVAAVASSSASESSSSVAYWSTCAPGGASSAACADSRARSHRGSSVLSADAGSSKTSQYRRLSSRTGIRDRSACV
mmetsp:Transcript_23706/g.58762  ORF Transcript_23706/g.58762 Transcript_23706/m.58762 type:complete len:206 (-) Transcript_23706:936-1553(-)